MKKNNLKLLLPYIGLPFIMVGYILLCISRTDIFIILLNELLIIFGYFATVIDIKTKTIPNKLIMVMFTAWVIAMFPKLLSDTENAIAMLQDSGLGFLVGGVMFLFVYIVSKGGMGGGDVKFVAVTGLYLGFSKIISAVFYGTLLAGLVSLVMLLFKKVNKKDTIPLAPFLYAGILLIVFFV